MTITKKEILYPQRTQRFYAKAAKGPSVKGPNVKKLTVRLILGRSQFEQRIGGLF
jgi:hypothetical protein